jgi:hypothetical protein
LGLTFDRRLNWHAQCKALLKSLHIAAATINKAIIPRVTPKASTILTFVRAVMMSIATYGMVFWSHSLSARSTRRIDSAIALPLRRALALPRDANTIGILVEHGLPSFANLRSISTIRFTHALHHNQMPPPIQQFFRRLPPSQHSATAQKRRFIREISNVYSEQINWDALEPDPPPLHTACIITHQTLDSSNITFKSIKSSASPSLFLSIDDPQTAATRANMRSGHRLNVWKVGKYTQSDECPHCKQPESIDHVILHCPAYDATRVLTTTLLATTLNNTVNFSVPTILGDDSQPIPVQKACLQISAPFINEIERIRRF